MTAWVWRFRLVARSPDGRLGLRFEVDVAGPYGAASALAKAVCIWRGGRRPILLGVRRVRAAGAAPERADGCFDVRF